MLDDENKITEETREKANALLAMKRMIVIGAGGTGCAAIRELSRLGAKITIIDRDVVEAANLSRQVLYSAEDIGQPKAIVASARAKNNSKGIFKDLSYKNIQETAGRPDLIIDCTDNIDTRLLINDYCKKYGLVWIHTAAILNIGTVMLISPDQACYRCTYQEKQGDTCDANVENTVLEQVGKRTAEAARNLLVLGRRDHNLIRITSDGKVMKIATRKNPGCPSCNGNYEYLDGKRSPKKLCGSGRYMIDLGKELDLEKISEKLTGIQAKTPSAVITAEFTIMKSGRVIVKAKDELEAKKKISDNHF